MVKNCGAPNATFDPATREFRCVRCKGVPRAEAEEKAKGSDRFALSQPLNEIERLLADIDGHDADIPEGTPEWSWPDFVASCRQQYKAKGTLSYKQIQKLEDLLEQLNKDVED